MVNIQQLLDNGVLIDPELLAKGIDEDILALAVKEYGDDLLVINREMLTSLEKKRSEQKSALKGNVKVVWSYNQVSHKRSYNDFVKALQMRFKEIEIMLKARQELSMTTSIARIRAKQEREHVACIGMVVEKQTTSNGNIILTIEDKSASIKALISEKKKDLFTLANDIQLDEILGFTANGAGEIIFVDNIFYPDIPLTKELKKAPKDGYAAFVGDPHFGSKVFLKEDFERFLLWINGKVGNDEQRKIAELTKYVFITGDLIEGVGIYPGQENDLEIVDITKQYEYCAAFLSKIPKDKHIIIFTGNHDAGRLSEPQEPMMYEYAKSIYDLPNATIVSNPSLITIDATPTFPGFDCLLYHGGSFIYYADMIPSIRAAGGQKRVDLVMKFLLQRRHLAPTHNAALTLPTLDRDWLLIDRIPDFFVSGHIHRVSVSDYRNVTCINAGCWTETTDDQVKRGLEPQPSKLVLMNLRTRKAKVMNFKRDPNPQTKIVTGDDNS